MSIRIRVGGTWLKPVYANFCDSETVQANFKEITDKIQEQSDMMVQMEDSLKKRISLCEERHTDKPPAKKRKARKK